MPAENKTRVIYRPQFSNREYTSHQEFTTEPQILALIKAHIIDSSTYLERTNGDKMVLVKHGDFNHRVYHQIPHVLEWCSGSIDEVEDIKVIRSTTNG